jgi:hypothetical protein
VRVCGDLVLAESASEVAGHRLDDLVVSLGARGLSSAADGAVEARVEGAC